jgi:mRNA interferase MazF
VLADLLAVSWPVRRFSGPSAEAPGSTLLPAEVTDLPKDSVANATQLVTVDRSVLAERVGRLGPRHLAQIPRGVDVVLG